jgi:predicted nucleotidyltransferase
VNVTAREGDFLESVEGLIFDVKGDIHPPDRVISFVRYVPDSRGDRKKEGRSYRKIYDLKERFSFLKEKYPHYVYFDPVFQRELQGMPLTNIKNLFYPREKFKALCDSGKRGELEESAVQLAEMLHIPQKAAGVSGSILVGLHTAHSDIDLVVYGEEHCIQAYDRLRMLRDQDVVHQFGVDLAKKKAQFRWGSTSKNLVKLEQKKILHGSFQQKEYFFRFLKLERKEYNDVQYVPLHKAALKAVVTDDTDSIFTPCCYRIEDSSIEGVERLVSLRGRFCEQVKKGDTITARGTVEKVCTPKREYYQMMLGDHGDYLLSVCNQ